MSRRTSRTTWAVLGAILLAQVGLLAWHHSRATAQPHRVPVAIEGPAAVAQNVAHRLNALSGEPLHAVVVAEGDDPRADVRNGGVVAALAVDPSAPGNVLYVSSVNDPKMTRLAQTMATRVSTPLGRTFVTRTVPPSEHDGPCAVDGRAGQRVLGRRRVPARGAVAAGALATRYVDRPCRARPRGARGRVRGDEPARGHRPRCCARVVRCLVGAGVREHVRRRRLDSRARRAVRAGGGGPRQHAVPVPRRSADVRPRPTPAPGILVAGGSLDAAGRHPRDRRHDRLVRLVGAAALGRGPRRRHRGLARGAGRVGGAAATPRRPGPPDRGGALAAARGRARAPVGSSPWWRPPCSHPTAPTWSAPCRCRGPRRPSAWPPRRSPPSRS